MVVKNNKKAQEEMVGFVLIVALVAVVAVIFLGISLRNPVAESSESERLASFLSATTQVTTNCEVPSGNVKTIGQLVTKCVELDVCEGENTNPVNGQISCKVLEDNLKEIVGLSFPVKNGSFTSSYNLTIIDSFNTPIIKPIIAGNLGNCLGKKLSNSKVFTLSENQGQVTMHLEVCFNE